MASGLELIIPTKISFAGGSASVNSDGSVDLNPATKTVISSKKSHVFSGPGPFYSAKANGLKGDVLSVSDGTISVSTAILTSATGLFTSADVGKYIEILGAGSGGAVLATTVLAYTSATQVTLNTNALTSVVNAPTTWGTDDGIAFNNLLIAINATGSGGRLYLDPGIYWIGRQCNVNTKISIVGAGKQVSRFKYKANSNTSPIKIIGNYCHIADIGIDGNGANNTSNDIGITITGAAHTIIERCDITSCFREAIQADVASSDLTIQNCTITDGKNTRVLRLCAQSRLINNTIWDCACATWVEVLSDDCKIINNKFTNSLSNNNILFRIESNNVVLDSNVIVWPTGAAAGDVIVTFWNSSQIELINNHITGGLIQYHGGGAGTNGAITCSAKYNRFIGNYFVNSYGFSICAGGGKTANWDSDAGYFVFSGNNFLAQGDGLQGSFQNAIICQSPNSSIIGNTVSHYQDFGIWVPASNCVVVGNYVSYCDIGQGGGGITTAGNNILIANNICQNNGTVGVQCAGISVRTDDDTNCAAVTNIRIFNNISGNTPGGNQAYGIEFSLNALCGASPISDCSVANNDLRTNTVSAIHNGGVATSVLTRNNTGYNPVGTSSVTVTASPFTYTASGSPETLYIFGGTVSSVTKNSVQIAATTNVQVQLEPFETIIVTYSVLPTIIKDIH